MKLGRAGAARQIPQLAGKAMLATWLALGSYACQASEEPSATATGESSDPGGEVRLYAVDRYEGVRQLDPHTLEVIATIDSGPRPHGIVASPDGRTLYITLEASNEVIQVDVASHRIEARVEVGPVPNEPTLSLDGRYLFVPQRGGDQADVVDTRSMTVVKTLPTGRRGHNAYTSFDGKSVFVTSMGDDLISEIDVASLQIKRQIPVGGVPRPLSLTKDGNLAYLALSGLIGFVTVDLGLGEVVHRLEQPIPAGTPAPPLDTYTHGLLLTPDQRELWVAAYATDTVYAYLMPERQQLAAVPVQGGGPHWLTLHPDGEPLYVSLEKGGQVAAIHRGLREVIRRAPVGQAPTRILAFRVQP